MHIGREGNDQRREDAADRLATVISEIQKLLWGTEYTFDLARICDENGVYVDLRKAA